MQTPSTPDTIPTLRQAAEHFAVTAQRLLQVCQDMQGELCTIPRRPATPASTADRSSGASAPQ